MGNIGMTATIVLIDAYEVPLNKAYQNGYYPQMVNRDDGIESIIITERQEMPEPHFQER